MDIWKTEGMKGCYSGRFNMISSKCSIESNFTCWVLIALKEACWIAQIRNGKKIRHWDVDLFGEWVWMNCLFRARFYGWTKNVEFHRLKADKWSITTFEESKVGITSWRWWVFHKKYIIWYYWFAIRYGIRSTYIMLRDLLKVFYTC